MKNRKIPLIARIQPEIAEILDYNILNVAELFKKLSLCENMEQFCDLFMQLFSLFDNHEIIYIDEFLDYNIDQILINVAFKDAILELKSIALEWIELLTASSHHEYISALVEKKLLEQCSKCFESSDKYELPTMIRISINIFYFCTEKKDKFLKKYGFSFFEPLTSNPRGCENLITRLLYSIVQNGDTYYEDDFLFVLDRVLHFHSLSCITSVHWAIACSCNSKSFAEKLINLEGFGQSLTISFNTGNPDSFHPSLLILRQIYSFTDIDIPGFDIKILEKLILIEENPYLSELLMVFENLLTNPRKTSIFIHTSLIDYVANMYFQLDYESKKLIVSIIHNIIHTASSDELLILLEKGILGTLAYSLEIDDREIYQKSIASSLSLLELNRLHALHFHSQFMSVFCEESRIEELSLFEKYTNG